MLKVIEGMLKKRATEATAEFRDYLRQVGLKAPPLRIELIPTTDASWLDAPAVQDIVQHLRHIGFQPAGVLAVKGNEKVVLAGFAAPEHRAYASIPKSGDHGFLSFISHFADGSAFECSNMPVPFEPPCPDWLLRRRHVGASPQALWAGFWAQRPTKEMTEATVAGFAASNMEDYFRYQTWMAERGGATRDELATHYKAIGKLPEGEEREKFLNMARWDEAERSLCNWWRLQTDAPAPLEAVLGSLIIIHDEMSPDLLINAYWCATDDFKAKNADFAVGSPREWCPAEARGCGGFIRNARHWRPIFTCQNVLEDIRRAAQSDQWSEPPPRWAVGRFGSFVRDCCSRPGVSSGGR